MINVIIVGGNATVDPTTNTTASGKKVARFRLAVNNPLNEKEVLYIDVDTWEKQADFVEKYVKKGSALCVVGRLKMDEFTGKDGQKRSKYTIITERLNFVGGGKKADTASNNTSSSDDGDVVKEVIDDEAFANTAAKAMAKLRASASASKTNAAAINSTEDF